MKGQMLTSADPEPPVGSVVQSTTDGLQWANLGYWVRMDGHGGPKSWTKVAGNYGPVVVILCPEGA